MAVEKLLDFQNRFTNLEDKMLKSLWGKFLVFLIVVLVISVGFWLSFSFGDQRIQAVSLKQQKLFINSQDRSYIESPELTFIQNNSLAGVSCLQIFSSKTLAALSGEEIQKKEITEYVVQPGDTLGSIAADFGISLNTILWANDLGRNSIIRPGQKLIILPVSGVIHHVKKGDTLSEIARTYKAKIEDIIAFNDLSEEGDIYVGDILIIPGGVKPVQVRSYSYSFSQIPVASSYFIVPVSSPYRVTQGLHWYNAVDFANVGNSCGKPVFAAAGGKVLKVKYGYNRGAGNYIRILHPNGLITHYGHLQKILVVVGQEVSQGELIGLIGHSGKTIPAGSAGCHLHFGLYSSQGSPPRNPFAR